MSLMKKDQECLNVIPEMLTWWCLPAVFGFLMPVEPAEGPCKPDVTTTWDVGTAITVGGGGGAMATGTFLVAFFGESEDKGTPLSS